MIPNGLFQSVEKDIGLVQTIQKTWGELLCPKRSTGTFWRLIKVRTVKRGSGRGRSPSKCFRISHPLLRFLEAKGDFAVCGQRPKGSALWKPATFEKVDETFTFVFICATFFVLLLFLQTNITARSYAVMFSFTKLSCQAHVSALPREARPH